MINPNDPGAGVKQYPTPTNGSGPGPIAAGPDGNYWFFEEGADQFGVFSPSNPSTITEIPLLTTANPQVEAITAGPNGTLWFTEYNADQVGMINTANDQIIEFLVPTAGSTTVRNRGRTRRQHLVHRVRRQQGRHDQPDNARHPGVSHRFLGHGPGRGDRRRSGFEPLVHPDR